jgi:hypothetical protein
MAIAKLPRFFMPARSFATLGNFPDSIGVASRDALAVAKSTRRGFAASNANFSRSFKRVNWGASLAISQQGRFTNTRKK